MSFIETPRFPNNVAFGALVGPEYKTEIVELYSGHEQRNVGWDQGLIVFELEMPLSSTQMAELTAWHRACKGRGHGFRVRDPSDYTTDSSMGRLGSSDNGAGVPTYQMCKKYAAGSLTELRNIKKPVASPAAAIFRGGVQQTAGGAAGNYAIDTTTGIVTFVADSSSTVTAVTPGATTIVTLTAALAGLAIGGRLYLLGLTGTIASTLNGIAHAVTNITGGGLNVYTLSTVTTGLTWSGSGSGYKYPQPTEALYWTGTFDVPSRFEADLLGLRAVAPSRWTGPVRLRELREVLT